MKNLFLHIKTVAVLLLLIGSILSCRNSKNNVEPDKISQPEVTIIKSSYGTSTPGVYMKCPNGNDAGSFGVNLEILVADSLIVFDSIWVAVPKINDSIYWQPDTIKRALNQCNGSVFKLLVRSKSTNKVSLSGGRDFCETKIAEIKPLPIASNEQASGILSYFKNGKKNYAIIKNMTKTFSFGW
ncbi:MAG: hypothetical protein EAZ07_04130 [Cytophagales bacterium]|nr:MAG: hypothetical protein EAZ07_04130 [Cytophagales bacterium]